MMAPLFLQRALDQLLYPGRQALARRGADGPVHQGVAAVAAGIQHRQIVEVDPGPAQGAGDYLLAVYPVRPRPQLLVTEAVLLTRTLSPLSMPKRVAVAELSRTRLLGFTWRRRSEPMLMELMVWDL